MPTWTSFAAFGVELQRMATDLTRDEKPVVTREMGRAAQKSAKAEAERSLGSDRAFSGWRRNRQIPADTRLQERNDGATTLGPTAKSAGIWTTAELGRNKGGTSVFLGPGASRSTGETLRTKSGRVRKVRATRERRWNGYTDPKRTATKAVKRMERDVPRVADKAVRKVIAKRFDVS